MNNRNLISLGLVKWEGLTADEATWENLGQLQHTNPSLDLEGKVVFIAGGDVMKGKGAKPMNLQGSKSTLIKVPGLNEDKGKWLAKRKSERQRVESTRLRDSVKL